MNGLEQVKAMRKLCNSEQAAPAESAWRPTELGGFRIGDAVRLPSIAATLEVIDLCPPSLLVLRAPSGHELRAGWRVVSRVTSRTRTLMR